MRRQTPSSFARSAGWILLGTTCLLTLPWLVAVPSAGIDPSWELGLHLARDRGIVVTLVKLKKDKSRKPGGELAKPWLGIKTQVLTPKVARALGLKGRQGYRISEVYPWTKAHDAGFQVGDILIKLDDETLVVFAAKVGSR